MRALKTYLEPLAVHASFEKLIALLIKQRRSYLLPEILEQIIFLYQERNDIEAFTIASPIVLDEKEMKTIENFLSRATGHTVLCTRIQDESLIAGIRVQSFNYQWEHSICKQLRTLARYLKDEKDY